MHSFSKFHSEGLVSFQFIDQYGLFKNGFSELMQVLNRMLSIKYYEHFDLFYEVCFDQDFTVHYFQFTLSESGKFCTYLIKFTTIHIKNQYLMPYNKVQ